MKLLFILLLAGGLLSCAGCDRPSAKDDLESRSETSPTPDVRLWHEPTITSLQNLDSFRVHNLQLSTPELFPDCHEIFEKEGSPVNWPFKDPSTEARTIYGCSPEAYEVRADHHRYLAYRLPAKEPGPHYDMRAVAYDEGGHVKWHHRLDRSAQGRNFEANFRSSFFAHPSPRLSCAGTLWEGGTQIACVDEVEKQVRWEGTMQFWAGVYPVGYQNSLFSADISGITRRYPFSGAEMRHRAFDNASGGRMAFYAADDTKIYFAPFHEAPQLTAYAIETMQPAWVVALPNSVTPNYSLVVTEHQLLIIKIGDTLYGVHTDTGDILWALSVGDDLPSMTYGNGSLYVLLRGAESANQLFSIDPDGGQIKWVAPTPHGTLHTSWHNDRLLIRSVRAVQEVLAITPLEQSP